MSSLPQGVHFVGSLPIYNVESAFTTIAATLPQYVLRCPDGEPGQRANFTAFQYFKFPEAMRKSFAPDTTSAAFDDNKLSEAEVRSQLKDLATEYDEVGISSYAIFKKLKEDGTIPKHVKFQVCFPTTTCVISAIRLPYQPLAEEIYRSALLRALQNVQDHVPHHELAIQIDCKSPPCLAHNVLISTNLLAFIVWQTDPLIREQAPSTSPSLSTATSTAANGLLPGGPETPLPALSTAYSSLRRPRLQTMSTWASISAMVIADISTL